MFDEFRTAAKAAAQNDGLTYADIAIKTDISESSIKLFMCGASDSRRVAEKMADALGLSILYHDGDFKVLQKEGGINVELDALHTPAGAGGHERTRYHAGRT